jgi:hypothetical protein
VTLSARDRKILVFLAPLLLIAAYWFLLLAPKREEVTTASENLTVQEDRLEAARSAASTADDAKDDFQASYATIVRLGKAIPATVDMPSLLVQLEAAAEGTGIRFNTIAAGERTPVAAAVAAEGAPAEGGEAAGSPRRRLQAARPKPRTPPRRPPTSAAPPRPSPASTRPPRPQRVRVAFPSAAAPQAGRRLPLRPPRPRASRPCPSASSSRATSSSWPTSSTS